MRAWMPLWLLLSGPAFAALPSGVSGSWYNPAESGHGFSVEVLSDESALVFWYTYDTQGAPLTLYIEGRIEGTAIVGNALAPSGMRFGAFRREDLVVQPWGSLRIEFANCNEAVVAFEAIDPAFGEGEFPLRRLTRIKDSQCALAFPERLDTGLYRLADEGDWHAAVDEDGVLRAISSFRAADGTPQQNHQVTNHPPQLLEGKPLPAGDGVHAVYEVAKRIATWQIGGGRGVIFSTPVSFDAQGRAEPVAGLDFEGRREGVRLQPGLTLTDLAGSYRTQFVRFVATDYTVAIGPDGSICGLLPPCGGVTLAPDNAGFFDFTLPAGSTGGPFGGRGWLEIDEATGQREIVLIGENANATMGLVARKVASP